MFPSSVVLFAFGLYDVTVQLCGLVDSGPWEVLPGQGLALGALWCHGLCQIVSFVSASLTAVNFILYVSWGSRLTGAPEDPVMEDLLGRRYVGPNWC